MENNFVYIDQDGIDNLAGYVRTTDMFGIPLQFAGKFWGDDPRGEMAKIQIAEVYGTKIAALIEQQKKDGSCFSSIKEAKEKFSKGKRYYIDTILRLYLDTQQSDDSFFTSGGDQDGLYVIMGMSTSKLILNKISTKIILNAGQTLRVWGYLIEIPRGFQIKPHAVWYE
ncbi:MAG: hypothetical protein LBG96_12810 [Tannerella sp.]|jgi:hypothetical protein|nr:hypothetical protein [Tannerella sp.]